MRLLSILLFSMALQGSAEQDDSCRCSRSQASVERDFKRADVVFVGNVLSLEHARDLENPRRQKGPRIQKVTFEVTHIFKGGNATTYELYMDLVAPCAFQFVVPDTYVVYAWRAHVFKNRLTTTRCVRTALIAGADEDVRTLRKLAFQKPKEE